MHGLCASACKTSIAKLALERFGTSVNVFVFAQFGIFSETFATNITLELSVIDRGVFALHVSCHFLSSDHFTTFWTRIFDMNPFNMFFQIVLILERVRTMWTNQLGSAMHRIHMLFHVVDM